MLRELILAGGSLDEGSHDLINPAYFMVFKEF